MDAPVATIVRAPADIIRERVYRNLRFSPADLPLFENFLDQRGLLLYEHPIKRDAPTGQKFSARGVIVIARAHDSSHNIVEDVARAREGGALTCWAFTALCHFGSDDCDELDAEEGLAAVFTTHAPNYGKKPESPKLVSLSPNFK